MAKYDAERYKNDPAYRAVLAAQQKRRRERIKADPERLTKFRAQKQRQKKERREDPVRGPILRAQENELSRERWVSDPSYKERKNAVIVRCRPRKDELRRLRYATDAEYREACKQAARETHTGFPHALVLALRVVQHKACAICAHGFKNSRDEHADHDHATGAPRGLLCRACNVVLGHYEKRMRARMKVQYFEAYLACPPVLLLPA